MNKLVLPTSLFACVSIGAAALPNIVVFISDDLGRAETSIYGNPEVRTPSMAKLASAGMTFNKAYVASPSCCPNRKSLLTGLMPARHGAHPNHGQVKKGVRFLLPILQDLGYHVASFGKVDHGYVHRDHAIPAGHNVCNVGMDFVNHKKTGMSKYIDEHLKTTNTDKPICLLVGDRRPHVPWIDASKSSYDSDTVSLPDYLIDTPETRSLWARYLTDITNMDSELGRVYDSAKERFGNNVIFMFTSDHGAQWPFGKWNLYEKGVCIPMVVVWPEKIEAGSKTDAEVSWVDILPTLIDCAGGSVPRDIDGTSFKSVFLGQTNTHRNKIFTTHTGDSLLNIYPIRAVRMGKYKLIHNLYPKAYHSNHSDILRGDDYGSYWTSWHERAKLDPNAKAIVDAYYQRPQFELFNLEEDPNEQMNLANNPEYQHQLVRLQKELSAWVEAQGDDLKAHKTPYYHVPAIEDINRRKVARPDFGKAKKKSAKKK